MTTQTKTAKFLRRVNPDARGDQQLYRVTPPLEGYEYVVASAADQGDLHPALGQEVYLFGSGEHGEIQDWGALTGSMRNTMRHEDALELAGYEVQL